LKFKEWYTLRGPEYIRKRVGALLERYGLTPTKAADRVAASVQWLAELGCAPTFPVPARVIQGHPRFFQSLQEAGVEISVHGYDHVALATYPPVEACEQLGKAVEVFRRHGIESYGFRCPYLSCSKYLIDALPHGLFEYSSNKAVEWEELPAVDEPPRDAAVAEVLHRVYKPASAREMVSTPYIYSGLVEIPVSLPDDLELHDARRLGPLAMGEVWSQILGQTHRRGEVFVLMFHPELTAECRQPLSAVLNRASSMKPAVWIARLRDISSWWHERAAFSVDVQPTLAGLQISFLCSERATVLVRNLEVEGSQIPWDGSYMRITAPILQVPAEPRPFLGLDADVPEQTASFLRNQGYLLDTDQTAPKCAAYLDAATLDRLSTDVELVEFVEELPGPLLKYGRWPDGAKSALSITGDLDALSLLDYASRVFVR
jgi:peptidoglycan/xylan/chitin deacetylase (PgdA/CDA1 family)